MSIKAQKPCNKTKRQRDEPAHEGNPWRPQRAAYWSQCSSSLLQYKMLTEIIARGCRQACRVNAFVVIALNKTTLYIAYCGQRLYCIGAQSSDQNLLLNLIRTQLFFTLPCFRSCHPRSHGLISLSQSRNVSKLHILEWPFKDEHFFYFTGKLQKQEQAEWSLEKITFIH